MTRQEIKENQADGRRPVNQIKNKEPSEEMARKRMMADVPKSDVVITNPTHLAIALLIRMAI